MARSILSPAKAVLLAVQLASKADIPTLRTLISQNRKTLHTELVLRILLSHLPESIDFSKYVPFLEDLDSANISEDSDHPVDDSELAELDDVEAKKRVRKLNLLSLRWPDAPQDAPEDALVLFLIHRAIRIDQNTGLITQLPGLLSPFLNHSSYLRGWMISSILPLVRFNYEYHPEDATTLSISKFEALGDRAGVSLLLSKTGSQEQQATIGRDIRGLVGPWMYGDTLLKRRKLRSNSIQEFQTLVDFEAPVTDPKYAGWEEVFRWLLGKATNSWKEVVEVVEQWDGPGDIDLGEYADGTEWLDEDDQLHLERRYARAVIASAYSISETSEEVLSGIQRILTRIITLLDKDRIPTLQAAAALLTPVTGLEGLRLSKQTAKHLRSGLLSEDNVLTSPTAESIKLLHALLISAFLCTKLRLPITIKQAGDLVFLQDEHEQRAAFTKLMSKIAHGPREDDKYWVKTRNEMLWLRDWGAEELEEGTGAVHGRGILGCLPKELIEREILKALLANTRYSLARSIYETSSEKPLPKEVLAKAVIAAAMNAYDNATNPNKTRGGVKKCEDILQAFPDTLEASIDVDTTLHLIKLTHEIGKYRLVLRQGEPFKPVALRVHADPISIIGRILEQNKGTYTSVDDFIDMAKLMVKAGLTVRRPTGESVLTPDMISNQYAIAEKRVVAMCVDAALTEDDFETAYSYVVTRLRSIAGPAHARTPDLERKQSGLFAEVPPKMIDDWSWRAALQAGKYRRTPQTVRPTHLGNTSANPEIRHLEQRMDCISQALRLAPKATLQEILNVFRRCEEELESHVQREQEQSEAWDTQGDESLMPGGFVPTPQKPLSRAAEEAPMSLFDLSKATFGSALSTINRSTSSTQSSRNMTQQASTSRENPSKQSVRKRDQLKSVAVGGLATGVGWLIGASPPPKNTGTMRISGRFGRDMEALTGRIGCIA